MRPAENVVRASSSGRVLGTTLDCQMPQPQRGDISQPISGEDATIPPASESHSHQDLSRRDRDAEIDIVDKGPQDRSLRCWNSATAQIESRLRFAKSDGWYQSTQEE